MDPVIMPQIGQDITIGRIVRWHKKELDPVKPGEVILTVESEKASFDVEAERSGVLLKILHREGEEVEVFAPVGYVGEPGEALPAQTGSGEAAARRARAGGPPAAGAVDRVIPFTSVRKIIAERLSLSSRTIPHFYLFQEIDMGAALAKREELNRSESVHVSVTALVAHAAVQALSRVPELNAHVDSERILRKAHVHLGIAVASERGLVVPIVASAGGKGLLELAAEIKEKTAAARRGQLELTERGTFTVTSLGMFGVPAFLPLINPPECAILAAGAVEERVVARNGGIAVRPVMTVTLGCDHRAVDGDKAARFLRELKERLESEPGGDASGEGNA
jgi:pyruvate dehydrogenase E2 component (dihydrolipoamide acetyltransferase)